MTDLHKAKIKSRVRFKKTNRISYTKSSFGYMLNSLNRKFMQKTFTYTQKPRNKHVEQRNSDLGLKNVLLLEIKSISNV